MVTNLLECLQFAEEEWGSIITEEVILMRALKAVRVFAQQIRVVPVRTS